MEKYLVLFGDEWGINILNFLDLQFYNYDVADELYNKFIEDGYASVVMYKITDKMMELVKKYENIL